MTMYRNPAPNFTVRELEEQNATLRHANARLEREVERLQAKKERWRSTKKWWGENWHGVMMITILFGGFVTIGVVLYYDHITRRDASCSEYANTNIKDVPLRCVQVVRIECK